MDAEQIVVLLPGFILTTVLGGLLGHYLQNRAWKHQNNARLLETERQAATAIYEDLSTLLDKRLYRMRQLCWKLGMDDDALIEQHMERYREVLYEWNDSLNRNLARVQNYFGDTVRGQLEHVIYEEFARLGSQLEGRYAAREAGADELRLEAVEKDLDTLSSYIYVLNVSLISLIQAGRFGIWREGASPTGYPIQPQSARHHPG